MNAYARREMRYLFRGSILAPNGRIERQTVRVPLQGGAGYPAGTLVVKIADNAITGEFDTAAPLDEAALATVRNIVKDVAGGLSRCLAVIEGTWAIAVVNSVEAPDGSRMLFDEVAWPLKQEFSKYGVTVADVGLITGHPEGYSLRNAIDNIALGLMEPKFGRIHFYCAVEALRTSMAPDSKEGQQWETFRNVLGVTRAQIDTLRDNALRHGNYGSASTFTSVEREAALSFLGQVLCAYIGWFKRIKLIPSTPPAASLSLVPEAGH